MLLNGSGAKDGGMQEIDSFLRDFYVWTGMSITEFGSGKK